MVDPRDTMLNNARALHERDEYNPGVCATCNTNDRYQAWPCPTATALGATGRSEWTTTVPETSGQCTSWGPDGNNWPTNEDDNYRCIRHDDHTGNHNDGEGHTW